MHPESRDLPVNANLTQISLFPHVPYIETSAATGYQVTAAVDRLLDLVMTRIEASVTKARIHGNTEGTANLKKSSPSKPNCAC
ncbi:unnamed protein product [Trichobilharzia regenti]|nr:unnamed protein product [Trichobilharzia regenti]